MGSKGKLTRELALEKLSAALDCPVVLVMPEGKITDHFKLDMPMPSLRAAQESSEVLKGLERESGIIKLLTSMAKGGFISFSYSRPRIVFDPKARVQPLRAVYEIEVALTKRGKEFQMAEALADFPFSLSLKYFLLSPVHEKAFSEEFAGEFDLRCLKLCEKIVTGVTGIRKAGKASATVDFEWKFDRLTALGEFISQDFAWTYNDGFFAVMSLREGTWSRVVDLLDPRISTRENARFIRDESGWRVEGGENP
ncbi:MAG: hypothetical protein FJY81_05315 [Candidatus Aminicenantes bacterium]|nr:hypothetical protein [Candidatus Aminicenantes bacterium]